MPGGDSISLQTMEQDLGMRPVLQH